MSAISITAAIFACQLTVCDLNGCGNITEPSLGSRTWNELVENVEARMTDCEHAELRRADKPDHIWPISAAVASYGFNDVLHQVTLFKRGSR